MDLEEVAIGAVSLLVGLLFLQIVLYIIRQFNINWGSDVVYTSALYGVMGAVAAAVAGLYSYWRSVIRKKE